MVILAIDPGPTQSGLVRFDGDRVLFAGVLPNDDVLQIVRDDNSDIMAIELFVATGQPLADESLYTVRWEERFRLSSGDPEQVLMIPRRQVKKSLGLNHRAGDKEVNAGLQRILGPKGTKSAPGPCYGVSSHAWAALGVAYAASRM
jgi:hypothetical protein